MRSRLGCRAATLVVGAAVAGGLLVAGCGGGGDGGGDQGYVEPKGKATEELTIEGGNFFFDPDDATARPGITQLDLVGTGGIHTLVFDDGEYPGFQLEVTGKTTNSKKIDLKPGVYGFYCDIPGHRQQGMVGTLTVK